MYLKTIFFFLVGVLAVQFSATAHGQIIGGYDEVLRPGWPVYSPLAGDVWHVGKTYEVAWDNAQILDTEVDIVLQNPACYSELCIALAPLTVGVSVPNTGKYAWVVPQNLNNFYTGSQYLKIQSHGDSEKFITSQSFTLLSDEASVEFSMPGNGSVLQLGKEYKIFWKGEKALQVSELKISPYYACLYTVPTCALAEPQPELIASNLLGKVEYSWVVGTKFRGNVRLIVFDSQGSQIGQSGVFSVVDSIDDTSKELSIVGPTNLTQRAGVFFSEEYLVSGGTAPYSWKVTGVLPSGVSLEEVQIQCIKEPCESPKDSAFIRGQVAGFGRFAFEIGVQDSRGLRGVVLIHLTVMPSESVVADYLPGTVLRTPDKMVRVILDDFEYYNFTSLEDFTSKGYRLNHIRHIDKFDTREKYLEHSFYRPSGTTFRYAGERTVYYVTKEYCKQAYTSFALFQAWRLQLADIVVIGPEELFPVCEENFVKLPDLMAVKGRSKTVYIHEKGRLRPVTSASAFTALGFNFGEVISLEDGELLRYPLGEEVK